MPKTNAETMTVRLPTQVANELIKLRDDKNLPTIGSALQVYIQKMKEDQIDRRLRKLETTISKLEGTVWPVLNTTAQISCKLASKNWGPESGLASRMRELLSCPLEDNMIKEIWKKDETNLKKLGFSYEGFKKDVLKRWRGKKVRGKNRPSIGEHVK